MPQLIGGLRDPKTKLFYVYGTINAESDIGLRLLVSTGVPEFLVLPKTLADELGLDITPDPTVPDAGTACAERLELTSFRDLAGQDCPVRFFKVPVTVVPDAVLRLGFEGVLGVVLTDNVEGFTTSKARITLHIL